MALWCGAWFRRSFGLAPRSAFAQLVGRDRPSRRSLLASRQGLQKRQLVQMTSPAYLSAVPSPKQDYDYFLVLDFEATCSRQKGVPSPQEIIEFPVLKVSGRTFETEARFHTYVQPQEHPQLTPFCTELTGIVQEMVDGQPHLTEVLAQFDRWMDDQGLREARIIFVTFGDWDLQKMLPSQCAYLGIPVPSYFSSWINIKKAFVQCTGHWPKTLPDALQFCGLSLLGHHHSGIGTYSNGEQLGYSDRVAGSMGNSRSADGNLADAVTGLSGLEKQAIRDTWDAFKKQLRTSSVTFFTVLFLRYPGYQKLFPLLADLPTDELRKNPTMIAHAVTFSYTITSIVDSLDDPEMVVEMVRKLAIRHAPRSPVMKTQFEHMGCTVVDVLIEKLGAAMTPTATNAWRKLFAFIVSTSAKVFQEVHVRNYKTLVAAIASSAVSTSVSAAGSAK